MNLKSLFGIQSDQEKVEEYRTLLKSSLSVLEKADLLAEEFSQRNSLAKSISTLGKEEVKEATERYNTFIKDHVSQVESLYKEKLRIEKSMQRLENDSEVGDLICDIKELHAMKRECKEGRISKAVYNDIIKAKSGRIKYADVLLFRGSKLLILQRAGDMGGHTSEWCIPGGHVDPGEYFKEAAARELFEETGIELPLDLLQEAAIATGKDFEIHYFIGHIDDESPVQVVVDSEEEIGSSWIEPSTELDDYEFIFDTKDNIKRILGIDVQPSHIQHITKAFLAGEISEAIFKAFCDSHPEEIKKANNKTYFSHKERKDLAEKGEAMSDGKYPIRNAEDLRDAIKLVGASDLPEEKVKAWIKKRAKALKLTDELPEDWVEKSENLEEDQKKEDPSKVEKTIDCDTTQKLCKEDLEVKLKKPDGDGIEKSSFSLLINFKELDQADLFKSIIDDMKNEGKLDINSVKVIEKSEDKKMYNTFKDFANFLEGAKTRTKNIHWGELDNSKHEYLDSLEEWLEEYEDKVMEAGQSKFGRFKAGEIKGEEITVNEPLPFIETIIERAKTFHEVIKEDLDYVGEMSWIEDFIGNLMQTKYRLQMH